MRILIVEDDSILGNGIQAGLTQVGIEADWAKTCDQARLACSTGSYEAMILDLGLPDEPGLNLLRDLREANNPMPILILTANDALEAKLAGFRRGADDYLVKPFELDELVARIRALTRRFHGRPQSKISYGNITFDPEARQVFLEEKPVEMSHREFQVLESLIENQGRVLSRAQLEQSLYGWSAELDSNAIEVHIHNLRKKLGASLIKTVRGVGYVIEKKGMHS